MSHDFEFVRLVGEERRVGPTLASVSRHWQEKKERFLFISPHDDDIALGAGLFIQHACQQKIPVYVLIVTDGSMGYCRLQDKGKISEIRKKETYDCYALLGVPRDNVLWLGFPDGGLGHCCGRRVALPSDAPAVVQEGFTGLQNAFTVALRKIRPTQCFLPTINDLHPDHKITYEEFMISVFHASGKIWPELGAPLDAIPHLHEVAVYCDFSTPPNVRIRASEDVFEQKLNAILAYKSQEQIQSIIDSVRKTGAGEFLKNIEFNLY
ncbi:MAG: PIG-L family deacetylase, partial [Fibrobacterota bacterium]